jgi:hypothetical protein
MSRKLPEVLRNDNAAYLYRGSRSVHTGSGKSQGMDRGRVARHLNKMYSTSIECWHL